MSESPSTEPGVDPGTAGRRTADTAPAGASPTARLMLETLENLIARIEEVEDRVPQGAGALNDRLSALAADVEGARRGTADSVRNLERAIARLSERLSRLEARVGPADDDINTLRANRGA